MMSIPAAEDSLNDRISELDSGVIVEILCHLPTRDAVRTSILSKTWKSLWTSAPALNLNEGLLNFQPHFLARPEKRRFACFLYFKTAFQILAARGRSETKLKYLKLSLPTIGDQVSFGDLYALLSGLSSEALEVSLKFTQGSRIFLPSPLFSLSELTHLKLTHCTLKLPTQFEGFLQLCVAKFIVVDFVGDSLQEFLRKSPLIKSLKIKACPNGNSFSIDLPMLKSLHYEGMMETISFGRESVLRSLSLFLPFPDWVVDNLQASNTKINGISHTVTALRELRLGRQVILFLASQNVALPLKGLQLLELRRVCFQQRFEFLYTLSLLRRCSNLIQLVISLHWDEEISNDDIDTEQYLVSQIDQEIRFDHLLHVTISDFGGTPGEFILIKLILEKSPNLLRVTVEPGIYDQNNLNEYLMQLLLYCRASARAVVELSA